MKRQNLPSAPASDGVVEVRDYNGTGRWSVSAVQTRYGDYCRRFHVSAPELPVPREHIEGSVRWVYPIMDSVINGIERGDKACIALGLDFIEEDAHFPFGKVLKSLRRERCVGQR